MSREHLREDPELVEKVKTNLLLKADQVEQIQAHLDQISEILKKNPEFWNDTVFSGTASGLVGAKFSFNRNYDPIDIRKNATNLTYIGNMIVQNKFCY